MINSLDITKFLENVSFITLFHLLHNFAIQRNYHCQPPNILFKHFVYYYFLYIIIIKNNSRVLYTSAGDIRLIYSKFYFLNDSYSVRSL